MKIMDPWNFNSSESNLKSDSAVETQNSFEDNFQPSESEPSQFIALEDSQTYLANLERKLKRLKNNPSILNQLKEKRENCLENLLNDNHQNIFGDSDLELEAPVKEQSATSEIIRHINPEQPISIGEVVHLVKYDYLEKNQDDNNLDVATTQESDDNTSR